MTHTRSNFGIAFICALAAAFCFWAQNGYNSEFCFTAGCKLFKNVSIAGFSFWNIGQTGFASLALIALLGKHKLGCRLAMLALIFDMILLSVMIFTAPCINCLIVAVFTLLAYLLFRHADAASAQFYGLARKPKRSVLAIIWGLLFIVNVAAVLKAEVAAWPLTENGSTASIHVYFSPSCPHCRVAVEKLSGNIDVAFYPVADKEGDVAQVAIMKRLIDQGASMHDALTQAVNSPKAASVPQSLPEMLLLHLRLMRNKAHILDSGAHAVPFIEYQGLPSFLISKNAPVQDMKAGPETTPEAPAAAEPAEQPAEEMQTTPDGTADFSIWGACRGGEDCDESENFNRRKRQDSATKSVF